MSIFDQTQTPGRMRRLRIGFLAALITAGLLVGCDAAQPPLPSAGDTDGATGNETQAESERLAGASGESAMEHALKHLDPKYVCPMHPQIVRDEPGSCPICGMDLVKKQMDPAVGKYPEVALRPAVMQNLGMRIGTVERGTLWKYIRTVGRVEFDETRLAHIHSRAEGWIEDLKLRAEGERVTKGQDLAEIYAPAMLSAQVDFLQALEPQPLGVSQVRADKARNLLRVLDIPDDVIRDIQQEREPRNRLPIRAPIDGIVTGLMARQGMYVTPETEMFTIADLSRVWVIVDVFEAQIDWLAPGLPAEIRVPARPGKVWEGRVDYLYPELDPKTRTLRVRLVFDNSDLALKPNMFADVIIFGGPKHDILKIPAEAMIVTGERATVVRVIEEGRFQPVDVVAGMERAGEVEILSGLEEGDRIVLSGQFLIDSESSLQASFMRFPAGDAAGTEPSETPGGAHAHH